MLVSIIFGACGVSLSSSSDDHPLSHSCEGTGMRFGTQNKFCHYRASGVLDRSLLMQVRRWEQYHDTADPGANYSDSATLATPCSVCW